MYDFFNMGGYAYYVWSSFAFGVLGIAYLYFSSKQAEKRNFNIAKTWNLRKAGKPVKPINEKSILRFVFPVLALLIPLIKVIEIYFFR